MIEDDEYCIDVLTRVSASAAASGRSGDAARLAPRRTLRTIRGNLFRASAHDVAALPLAATCLLDPVIAGAATAFGPVFVVANSPRLRSFRSRAGARG